MSGRISRNELSQEMNSELDLLNQHLAQNTQGAHTIANITGLQSVLDSKQSSLPVENRRKITFGTTEPTGGVNGDIYFQYE